jgi:ankyrin repeat protein
MECKRVTWCRDSYDIYRLFYRFRWVFCQLEALQHCLPQSIRRTLNELPISLDETYERVLKEIGLANRDHAHRLLQCLTVAIRPLRVEELAEILALDFDGAKGAIPKFKDDLRCDDRQRSVLSMCSSLITLVDDGDSRVIQFSHFSVKEFLTSNRLAQGNASDLHIMPEPAHTTFAQACLGTLLQFDGSSNSNQAEDNSPLAGYASRHWVEHAQFGLVSSRIEDGMKRLFDSTEPYFSAWLQLHDIDDGWYSFGTLAGHGSPLYYASLCGFRDLAAHIILENPEQVNASGGHNYSPLAAALYKKHFDVAELLYRHGAAVNVTGFYNRTPLKAASADGLIDVVRWLLDHGADADSPDNDQGTPILSATVYGHVEVVRTLLGHGVRINAANNRGYTSLYLASRYGDLEVVKLLLQHGADVNAQAKGYRIPLNEALREGRLEVAHLLIDHLADVNVEDRQGTTPLHLASNCSEDEIVHVLLDRGANPNAEDEDGKTPLHLASFEGKTTTVRLLLNHGASADVPNKAGETPLQVASREGRLEIVQMLTEHGVTTRRAGSDARSTPHPPPEHNASSRVHHDVASYSTGLKV